MQQIYEKYALEIIRVLTFTSSLYLYSRLAAFNGGEYGHGFNRLIFRLQALTLDKEWKGHYCRALFNKL